MKKTICILSIMILVSVSFGHLWTNSSGDQDFNRGSNWFDLTDSYEFTGSDRATVNLGGSNAAILNDDAVREHLEIAHAADTNAEVYITGGINTFTGNCAIGNGTNSVGILDISGGETNIVNSFTTVGRNGHGIINISDGVLNLSRTQLCQNEGSKGEYNISGGELNIERFLYVGFRGEGIVNLTGGKITLNTETLRMARLSNNSRAYFNMSGDSELNVMNNYTSIGDDGYGEFNMNGGVFNANRIHIALADDPNSRGYLYVTDGLIDCPGHLIVGTRGEAGFEISGGVVNAGFIPIAQGEAVESYPTNGYLTVSGGTLNVSDYIQVGGYGEAALTLIGNSGQINCSRFEVNGLSSANFILNGSGGVGKGIAAFGGTSSQGSALLKEGAKISTSFVDGTDVAGDYIVIASSQPISYLAQSESSAVSIPAGDATDFLASQSQTEGWTAAIVEAGSGSAFVASSPLTADKKLWASAGADDIAVIDDDSITLSSAKTSNAAVIGETTNGSLDITDGALGVFANLTIAESNDSAGSLTVDGGSVAVDSIAYIGKQGSASLEISGGTFSALNLLAASGDSADADIAISNNGSLAVANILALSAGSKLTISGYQSSVDVSNLTLGQGANITFNLDENHGVGSGIVVDNNVTLNGTISTIPLGERVETPYTLIRAKGRIYVNNPNLITSQFVEYNIVEDGEYEKLEITFVSPADCDEVISSGFGLVTDLNNDCYVDIKDFAMIARDWLICNNPNDPLCDLAIE